MFCKLYALEEDNCDDDDDEREIDGEASTPVKFCDISNRRAFAEQGQMCKHCAGTLLISSNQMSKLVNVRTDGQVTNHWYSD